MLSFCGTECCKNCPRLAACGGCREVNGHPFGGVCVAAEWVKAGGLENLEYQKQQLIMEFNSLRIDGLHVEDLNFLSGCYVNLEYQLPNDRCYGIIGDENYLLVCEYGCNGSDPEIVLYRKRSNELRES